MFEPLSLETLKSLYPDAVENGEIVLSKLILILVDEISDLKDQMEEKDYQILKITQRLENLES